MEFYIPGNELKRVTISNGGGKGTGKDTTAVAGGNPAGSVSSGRRISLRTLLPVVLVLGILLPFVLKEGDEDLFIFFLDFF
jgi:alpha-1,4-galacturonosyltransferase